MRPGETFTISAPVKNRGEEVSQKLKIEFLIAKSGQSTESFKQVTVGVLVPEKQEQTKFPYKRHQKSDTIAI